MQELSALGIETLELDVTVIDAIRRVRDDIATKTGGKLDVLVNNAQVNPNFPKCLFRLMNLNSGQSEQNCHCDSPGVP
jgi:NAD(P)-dependent dehydrogenase (short-subunit alcohol dehydrogenase family)